MGEKNKNNNYTEISDRAILNWAEKSGLQRPKTYGAAKSSNDKPEMNFGMNMMDDGSIRRVIHSVAKVQPRNYVVMELKANLVPADRKDLLARWEGALNLRKSAVVMVGEPPLEFKKSQQEIALQQKQE